MHSGQTRAVLARKVRAGLHIDEVVREKRIGDLAWQMTVTSQKLHACPREKRRAKEYLQKLYDEARAEYDRLQFDIRIEKAVEEHGIYLG